MKLWIDCETFNTLDIRTVSTARYAETAEVTVITWAVDDGDVMTWDVAHEDKSSELRADVERVISTGGRLVAANAAFDRLVLARHFDYVPFDPIAWECLHARAFRAGWARPGLGEMSRVLGLGDDSKLKDGKRLIQLFCVPRKPTQMNKLTRMRANHKPDDWKLFLEYARMDVVAMRECWNRLPDVNDSPEERAYWVLDQNINDRGWPIDRSTVNGALRIIAESTRDICDKLDAATGGVVTTPNQHARIKEYCAARGITLESTDSEAITGALARTDLPATVRTTLELRREGSRATNKKYSSLHYTTSDDNRLRHALRYYAACRSGRWTGRSFQPHNLIRADKQFPSPVVANAVASGISYSELQAATTRPALEILAYGIRGAVKASEGHTLVLGDLAQIEARMICWLAGDTEMLSVFADPERDPYTHAANKIQSKDRQLGKALTLGCGFGMSGYTFQSTANSAPYSLGLELDEAELAVKAWRASNEPIVSLWRELGEACIKSVREPNTKFMARGLCAYTFERSGIRYLGVMLPSSRWLLYPHVRLTEGKWDQDQITYIGAKGWTSTYGGKLVENVTQGASRDVLANAARVAHNEYGFSIVGHVHDELICEERIGDAAHSPEILKKVMEAGCDFATGLPLEAECMTTGRYSK